MNEILRNRSVRAPVQYNMSWQHLRGRLTYWPAVLDLRRVVLDQLLVRFNS
jgi:hypothetical protein